VHGTRQKTPAHLTRRLLARLIRWLPNHRCSGVGETGDGTSATARFCQPHRRHLTLVSTFSGEAALDEPPPPRACGTRGRPRVKGPNLASPQAVVATTVQRTRLMVAWSGGTRRAIAVVTGTGHWSRLGDALVEVRWVYVHDGTGTHRDEYFLTTERSRGPKRIVACDTPRGSIEPTFQACRAYLKRESPQGDGAPTVLRVTPWVCGLSTVVVLLDLQLPPPSSPLRAICWRGQATVTCSERITWVRRV
jgi:hypothetical protein